MANKIMVYLIVATCLVGVLAVPISAIIAYNLK